MRAYSTIYMAPNNKAIQTICHIFFSWNLLFVILFRFVYIHSVLSLTLPFNRMTTTKKKKKEIKKNEENKKKKKTDEQEQQGQKKDDEG